MRIRFGNLSPALSFSLGLLGLWAMILSCASRKDKNSNSPGTSAKVVTTSASSEGEAKLQGELKVWHRISLDFTGPSLSEKGNSNPFTDYWMEVTLKKGDVRIDVPGFFAADGHAGESSADSGNVWRAYFRPPLAGEWQYKAKFRTAKGIVWEDSPQT